ncbi:hypothetical protein MP228_002837 [Amoeboaphelidium protococcarum]|nr:hypothetical protein MP228_002837 [Amoeboaphelidium protococcarum]
MQLLFKVPVGFEDVSSGELSVLTRLYGCSLSLIGHGLILTSGISGDINYQKLIKVIDTLHSVELVYLFIYQDVISDPRHAETIVLSQCVQRYSDISKALNTWRSIAKITGLDRPVLKFRASCTKLIQSKGGSKLKFPGSDVLGSMVGCGVLLRFPQMNVNLTDFDLNFQLFIDNDASDAQKAQAIVGLELPPIFNLFKHDRYRVSFGRTAMKPQIAHCLARIADIQPGEIVLDCFAGVCTIPVEACMLQRRALCLASELYERTLYNEGHSNMNQQFLSKRLLGAFCADACLLPIRDHSLDVIISDLPWGVREGSHKQVAKTYPKFLRNVEQKLSLRQSSRVFLLTLEKKLLRRSIPNQLLQIDWERTVMVSGLEVTMFKIIRVSSSN